MTRAAPFLFPDGARFGFDNLVLHASSRRHRVDDFAGPLSIKAVVRGEVDWIVEGRALRVDPDSFLVLADAQRYSMNIDAPRPIETACVFFRKGFVEAIAHDASTPLADSLDDPERAGPDPPYLSRVHSDSERSMMQRVRDLAARCGNEPLPSAHEEEFALLGLDLLRLYREFDELSKRVPAARKATRDELLRRLRRARDYLHANSDRGVSLEETARVACLSTFHFHRAFQTVFGQTPHRYLTGLRLDAAHRRILAGAPVTEACMAAGFSSVSSFGRAFRGTFGFTPSRARTRDTAAK